MEDTLGKEFYESADKTITVTKQEQTAVEWLYDNLKSHFEHDGDLLEVVQFSFEQAKEMEKQQSFDSRVNGIFEGIDCEHKQNTILKQFNDK